VYSNNPRVPLDDMELSVSIIMVRNFSRSKKVDRDRMSVSQLRIEKRMVVESIAMDAIVNMLD